MYLLQILLINMLVLSTGHWASIHLIQVSYVKIDLKCDVFFTILSFECNIQVAFFIGCICSLCFHDTFLPKVTAKIRNSKKCTKWRGSWMLLLICITFLISTYPASLVPCFSSMRIKGKMDALYLNFTLVPCFLIYIYIPFNFRRQ